MNYELLTSWYQALPPHMRVYWIIAIAVTIIFTIQMVFTLIGLGDTDAGDMGDGNLDMGDGHADTIGTGGAIQLFTIRNTINFLLGVGWGGVCLSGVIGNRFLLALAAILCGCIMVAAFIVMYRQLMRLEGNGSYRIEESKGQVCEVYIRVPAHRSGSGKVQVSFHGSVQELPAQTEGEAIGSGTKVRVAEVIEGKLLIVEKL